MELLNKEIEFCKNILSAKLKPTEMILDREVVDKDTLEFIREATEFELDCFYTIRINEMKIRRMESMPEYF